MKLKDFKNALLVAMLRYQRKVGYNRYFEPVMAADTEGLAFPPGQVRLCINEFKDRSLIQTAFTMGGGPDGGLHSHLTAYGIEEAEELEQSTPELTRSNRYVRLADQETEIAALRQKVAELTKLVQADRTNTFEDREGVVEELAVLEIILTRPQISVPLIEKIMSETVLYLSRTFADQSIGILAGVAITLAAQAFSLSVSK